MRLLVVLTTVLWHLCDYFEILTPSLWLFFLENCPICLDTLTNPKTLRCKHVFCSECLQNALDFSNKCPLCQEPQGMLTGNQPPGEMRFRTEHFSVPGYEGNSVSFITCSWSLRPTPPWWRWGGEATRGTFFVGLPTLHRFNDVRVQNLSRYWFFRNLCCF